MWLWVVLVGFVWLVFWVVFLVWVVFWGLLGCGCFCFVVGWVVGLLGGGGFGEGWVCGCLAAAVTVLWLGRRCLQL